MWTVGTYTMASYASYLLPRSYEWGVPEQQWLGYETVVSSLDIVHVALVLISLVGVILAAFTEDASHDSLRVSWIATQLLPQRRDQRSGEESSLTDVQRVLTKLAERRGVKRLVKPYLRAAEEGRLVELLSEKARALWGTLFFYARILYVKRFAEGTRHLFYMAQKLELGCEVRPGESEVQTYVDAKTKLQSEKRWPFMIEVSDIKDAKIVAQGMRAYPMSSYSYLDFIREPRVQEAAIAGAQRWSTGSHGARMLGGNMTILRELERAVGKFYGREDSLLCATGFLATMSAIVAAAKKGDLILADHRAHASLRTGASVSGAKTIYWRHNCTAHLKKLLQRERSKYRNCWIVIESVYSMEGDIADLPSVRSLADAFKAKIICDEAHGLGVLGKTGRGLEEHYNMPFACDIICGTFSKSIAGTGGFITCRDPLMGFLDFHAPGSVFSAALTAYSASGALKAFELMTGEQSWRIAKAQENARYLRELVESGGGLWPADYPEAYKYEVEGLSVTTVVPVVFPNDPQRAFKVAMRLLEKGFYCAAAAFPACPLTRPRLRITATAAYTTELMQAFVKALVETTVEVLPQDTEATRTRGKRAASSSLR